MRFTGDTGSTEDEVRHLNMRLADEQVSNATLNKRCFDLLAENERLQQKVADGEEAFKGVYENYLDEQKDHRRSVNAAVAEVESLKARNFKLEGLLSDRLLEIKDLQERQEADELYLSEANDLANEKAALEVENERLGELAENRRGLVDALLSERRGYVNRVSELMYEARIRAKEAVEAQIKIDELQSVLEVIRRQGQPLEGDLSGMTHREAMAMVKHRMFIRTSRADDDDFPESLREGGTSDERLWL